MAQCSRYVCNYCNKSIEYWSDGNPYYLDEAGVKHYAYHPDHENLARCIGNDDPFFCKQCGAEFLVDSRGGERHCPQCNTNQTISLGDDLEKLSCPICRQGKFLRDESFFVIS